MIKPRILSIGEVLWDLLPDGARFGGAAANFACHAAILGGDVSIVSAVGADDRGNEALKILQSFGIEISLMQRIADVPTGSVSVLLDSAGKPTFEIHAGSAWDYIPWTTELEARIANMDAIHFGTLGQRCEISRTTIRQALSVARASGILRVLDVNLRKPFYDAELIRESIAWANVMKLSDEELSDVVEAYGISTAQTTTDTLQTLRERCGLDLIVLTRGAEGALLVSDQGTIDQSGIPTKVVDTVGAGDCFIAAFLLGLLRGEPHQDILRNACNTASAACAHSGAVPAHLNFMGNLEKW
jgi:fructokinase